MKVLVKRSRHLDDPTFRIDCVNCGSTLEYMQSEVFRATWLSIDNKTNENKETIKCCVCGGYNNHEYFNKTIQK
jgi:hypothetical protein